MNFVTLILKTKVFVIITLKLFYTIILETGLNDIDEIWRIYYLVRERELVTS